jgi:hypothetical protein
MPSKLFEVYQSEYPANKWFLFPCDGLQDWLSISVKIAGKDWQVCDGNLIPIEDNTLIRIDYADRLYRMIFHDHATCSEMSQPAGLWMSKIWDYDPIGVAITEELIPTVDRLWAARLEWAALYLKRHTWAAVTAIGLFAAGLYCMNQLEPPQPQPRQLTAEKVS